MMLFTERIVTPRLVLRCWRPDDAPLLKAAIDANLDHLRPWMPWAVDEPTPVDQLASRLERFATEFREGRDWTFGVFTPDESAVIGGAGLHPRIDERGLEIGYWIDAAHTGRGLATEAAGALTHLAFERPDIDHVEIRCDPLNVASAAVPKRLGYALVGILRGNALTSNGSPRDTMVWRLVRPARSPATTESLR